MSGKAFQAVWVGLFAGKLNQVRLHWGQLPVAAPLYTCSISYFWIQNVFENVLSLF